MNPIATERKIRDLEVALAMPRGSHWATKYIGKLYEKGACGPDAFDCWGLFWRIMADDFDIILPEMRGITLATALEQCETIKEGIQADWTKAARPEEGFAVAMSQRQAIHHIGVWTEAYRGRIIHAYEGMGVVASSIGEMKIRGFKVIDFYRHRLWPT